MSTVRKGFTQVDATTPEDQWGLVETQEKQDIEDTLVGDSVDGEANTSGHKHSKVYTGSSDFASGAKIGMEIISLTIPNNEPGAYLKTLMRPSAVALNMVCTIKILAAIHAKCAGEYYIDTATNTITEITDVNNNLANTDTFGNLCVTLEVPPGATFRDIVLLNRLGTEVDVMVTFNGFYVV